MMENHEQFLRFAFVSLGGVKYLQSFYVYLWTWVFFKPKALIFFDIAVYLFGRIYGGHLKHQRIFFSFPILSWTGNGANQLTQFTSISLILWMPFGIQNSSPNKKQGYPPT